MQVQQKFTQKLPLKDEESSSEYPHDSNGVLEEQQLSNKTLISKSKE
jgi:hypothetical protein